MVLAMPAEHKSYAHAVGTARSPGADVGQSATGVSSVQPLSTGEFAALVDPLAGPGPLAVAVSGGADSLALCLLAAGWAATRGRPLTALTVDHGLRQESASEAAQVGAWLAARGIGHVILNWAGAKPATGLQAAARTARYGLLGDWCRRNGVRDLLLGHHRDDQAETVLLRSSRASGSDGRAAMASVTERCGLCLLRPLLTIPRHRLRATLAAAGQDWIEDPSNGNPAFARVRARAALAGRAGTTEALTDAAAAHGTLRAARESTVAQLLATHAKLQAAGFCVLASAALEEPADVAVRALNRILTVVGGRMFPARREAVDQLLRWLRAHPAQRTARSLHGCVLAPQRDGVLICREARALPTVRLQGGQAVPWDNRFNVQIRGGDAARYEVGPLGATGWAVVRRRAVKSLPYRGVMALPALFANGAVAAVPHLGIVAAGVAFLVSPLSAQTLALRPFAVVSRAG